MDPLSALGLASNIISFVDFASNLVKDATKVHQSASGLPAEVHDAAIITESLEPYMARLSTATLKPGASVHDKALASLGKDCQKTCVELQQLVRKIKSKAPGSRTESFRVAWSALRRKGKLEELEKRLDKFQSQILSQLVFMLRDEHSETHGKITSLTALEDDRASEIQHLKQEILTMIQSEMRQTQAVVSQDALEHGTILCEIRDALTKISTVIKFASGEKQILDMLWFSELETRFSSIQKAHEGTYRWLLHDPDVDIKHDADNDSITFSSVSGEATEESQDSGAEDSTAISSQPTAFLANESQPRHQETGGSATEVQSELVQRGVTASAGVPDLLPTRTSVDTDQLAAKATSPIEKEMVQRQVWREQFLNWLQHDNGLFYISGKPGSGKSTLMKSICQDPHSRNLLRLWANKDGKDLLFMHFFFWNSGSQLQRSIEGLYRGMIWDVLRKRPDLTEQLFPVLLRQAHKGEMYPSDIDPATLETAFKSLIGSQQLLSKNKVCLFIDGLDEYEGDHWKLAKHLKNWCSEPNVKLCVSSRPYNEFVKVFTPTTGSWLKLHELTRGDIQRVVRDQLSGDERFVEARRLGENYDDFITSIVNGADGVFIWVVLVIRSLLTGIGNSCSLAQLRTRLRTVPREINSMFRYMLAEIELPERQAAARVFLTLRNDVFKHELSSLVFVQAIVDRLFDEPEFEKSLLDGTVGPSMKPEECTAQCKSMCDRITGRCRGLLQVNASLRAFPACHNLQLVHRTLYDFLGDKEVMDELREMAGDFSVHRSLALGLLAMVKYLPRDNPITCPKPSETTQLTHEEARNSLHIFPTAMLDLLFQLAAAAEKTGSVSVRTEVESMSHMLAKHATSGHEIFGDSASSTGWEWHDITRNTLESATIYFSVLCGAHELALEMIQRQDLDIRQKNALLFVSSWTKVALVKPIQTYDPLRTARYLLERKVTTPNCKTGNVVFWECSDVYREDDRKPYFPMQPWTPWTLLLLRLSQAMVFGDESSSRTTKECLRLFLEHGADPSVCFVGYQLLTGEDDFRRHLNYDEILHQNDKYLEETLIGPIYTDLPTLLEIWDPGAKRFVEDLLSKQTSTAWPRLLEWPCIFGSKKSADQIGLKQVGSADIKRADFIVLQVAPLHRLKDIQLSDLNKGLGQVQELMKNPLRRPLGPFFMVLLSCLA